MDLRKLFEEIKIEKDEKLLKEKTIHFISALISNLTLPKTSFERKECLYNDTEESYFWGYVFNLIVKEIRLDYPAPMAVAYKDNQFHLIMNPTLWKEYTIANVYAILLHEGYHLLFNHLSIFKDALKVNREVVNIATDCEINQHIKDLPDNVITLDYVDSLIGEKLKVKAGSMYYYEKLLKDFKKDIGDNKKDKGDLLRHSSWEESIGDSFISSEDSVKKIIQSAQEQYQQMKGRGTLPSHIQEAIEKLNKPSQLKWQSLISRVMGNKVFGREDSINRLNRRFPYHIHKKGQMDSFIQPIIFAIDTSGSVSDKELSYFLNELRILVKKIKVPVTLLEFDCEVQNVVNYDGRENIKYQVKGRGGTSFQPIFDYLKKENISPLSNIFILTDGGGESKINTYLYHNYKWIITQDYLSVRDNTKQKIRLKIEE